MFLEKEDSKELLYLSLFKNYSNFAFAPATQKPCQNSARWRW